MPEEIQAKKSGISTKLALIVFLALLLMAPMIMVNGLVSEREKTRSDAIIEVGSKWGQEQTITGPILTVPYKSVISDKNGNVENTIKYVHFLPDILNVGGQADAELRTRGIYEIALYNANLELTGTFPGINLIDSGLSGKEILWNEAFIYLGLSDLIGVQEAVKLNWNGAEYFFNPGIETSDVVNSGVSIKVPLNANAYKFTINLNLDGSRGLYFVPIGNETNVNLSSSWPSPKFTGSFLPDSHDVRDRGFSANWKVLNLNRNFPQIWQGEPQEKLSQSSFGFELFIPVDEYQKTTRSIKYSILVIGLTFLIFFFVEVLTKREVHPIHYILVGVALCIFYLLLLSISEHLSFNIAYLIAGLATILLITAYSKHIFKSLKLTLLQGAIMLFIYASIFFLIQEEDYALLMGSIGIFVVWAIIMFISRKINWYNTR